MRIYHSGCPNKYCMPKQEIIYMQIHRTGVQTRLQITISLKEHYTLSFLELSFCKQLHVSLFGNSN